MAASWRVARSLNVLLDEVNTRWPHRSKVSDGSIGDPSHSARTSDHNPNGNRVVCARDFTAAGIDADWLANHLRLSGQRGDLRVKYVIWNGRIASATAGWAWRRYNGENLHTSHIHVSVSGDPRHYDSTGPWGVSGGVSVNEGAHVPDTPRPAITTTTYALPSGEDMAEKRHDFKIICGDDGNGYTDIPINRALVKSLLVNCADPGKQGGWASPVPRLSCCALGGGVTRVRADGAGPKATLDVSAWAVAT